MATPHRVTNKWVIASSFTELAGVVVPASSIRDIASTLKPYSSTTPLNSVLMLASSFKAPSVMVMTYLSISMNIVVTTPWETRHAFKALLLKAREEYHYHHNYWRNRHVLFGKVYCQAAEGPQAVENTSNRCDIVTKAPEVVCSLGRPPTSGSRVTNVTM